MNGVTSALVGMGLLLGAAGAAPAAGERLQLSCSGAGQVCPNYSNAWVQVGRELRLTAQPAAGYVFSNWTGSGGCVLTNGATLRCVMTSNLVLQANFVPNPFRPLKGSYAGLFYPAAYGTVADTAAATNTGSVRLRLSDQGGYSGELALGSATLPFAGRFDVGLQSRAEVARPGRGPLALSLQLSPVWQDPETDTTLTNLLTGTVGEGAGWSSEVWGFRAAAGDAGGYAGGYSFLIRGGAYWGLCFGPGLTNLPQGDGVGFVKVTPAGAVRLTGTLPDGRSLLQLGSLSEEGYWPVFVPLYGGKGFVCGWMDLGQGLSAPSLYWLAPPRVPGMVSTNGFGPQGRLALMSPYVPSGAGPGPATWSNAVVTITGGDLPFPVNLADELTSHVVFTGAVAQVISGTISNLSLRAEAGTGRLKGSFVDPVSGLRTPFSGELLQDPGSVVEGGGWWIGPNGATGTVRVRRE
jgi:hypothetical protein